MTKQCNEQKDQGHLRVCIISSQVQFLWTELPNNYAGGMVGGCTSWYEHHPHKNEKRDLYTYGINTHGYNYIENHYCVQSASYMQVDCLLGIY